MVEHDTLNSIIFWGPPGTGKTTLSEIISENSGRKFFKLSAVSSGVKDVREVIDQAKQQNLFSGKSPILFIDEIHRFNKSQQDSLLHAVEKGWIVRSEQPLKIRALKWYRHCCQEAGLCFKSFRL